MVTTALDNLTLNVTQEIHVRASLDDTFEALLEQMGPANETPEGAPLAKATVRLTLEVVRLGVMGVAEPVFAAGSPYTAIF